MTSTQTTTRRRISAAVAGFAALALVTSPLPTAAGIETDVAPQSAQFLAPISSNAAATQAAARAQAAATRAAARAQAATTQASTDYSSIFAGEQPALVNSGWATCAAAVPWSVDTGSLSSDEAARTIANLQWAFDRWTQASGLTFQFAGTQTFTYDDTYFSLTPAGGAAQPGRHIYLAIVSDADSARMGGGTVGLGSPSQVWPSTKEIVQGTAVFRTDHVRKAGNTEARSLFIHELGHVLGLAHATEAANIMYPVVTDKTELGAGDVAGVRSMAKACAA